MPRTFAQHRPEDTEAEMRVAAALKRRLNIDCAAARQFCVYDLYGTLDGKPHCIVEVKRRNMYWGQFPTVHVSYKKLVQCLDAADEKKVCFTFAVECQDGIFAVTLTLDNLIKLPVKKGGRTDRGLKNDVELLVDIPLDYFTKIG